MANKPNKRPNDRTQQPQPQAAPTPKPVAKSAPAFKEAESNDMFSIRNLCIILGVLSFIIYANTLLNGFVMDDVMVLKENNMVLQGFKGIPELLTTPHMRGYLIIPNDLYRPLSLVMFAAEYGLFGLSPAVHHFFNVLTFSGCCIMLFLFLDKFFKGQRTLVAFVASLIFAVHPIHTEVVANIKSRDELMCFFFAFWALNLYMNYMKNGKMMTLILGTFVLYLSYISKETVIAFVGIVPLIFFLYHNDDKKRAIYITASMLVATGVFMAVRSSVLSAYDANQPATPVEFIDNALSGAPNAVSLIATKIVVLGMYLKLLFIPYPLLCTYSFNSIPFANMADWRFWLSLIAYGGMLYLGIKRFMKDKKDPWAFGIIFYLATLFLFSNLPFLMGAELAERFLFFASAGICLLAGLAVEQFIIKAQATDINMLKSTKVLTILVPVCLLFSGMTIARNMDWKDNYTLYKADVERSPRDSRLYHNVASALAEDVWAAEPDSAKKKQIDEGAIDYLKKGLEIYPDYPDLYIEMARIYDRKKLYDSAIKYNAKGLELNPNNFTANNNLGSVMLTAGKYRESIPLFQKAMDLNPNFKFAYLNIARAYNQLKIFDSALLNYNKMLQFEPQNVDIYQEKGTAFFMMGKYDSSEYNYKKVLELKPDDPNAVNNIGAILLNTKRYGEAVGMFKKAVALSPNYINAYSNLARAYYFSGQYPAAIETINKEIQLDQNSAIKDIPYIALSYLKMGNMAEAKKWEATSKKYYSNFTLEGNP